MAEGARRRAAHRRGEAASRKRTVAQLDALVKRFGEAEAQAVKAIEARTNHDVKAIEYFLKERLGGNEEIARVAEFIHFACTSEDMNNLCHALMLEEARGQVMLPALDAIIARLTCARARARRRADARAHARAGRPRPRRSARSSRTSPHGSTARAASLQRVTLLGKIERRRRQLQRASRGLSGHRLGAFCRASS